MKRNEQSLIVEGESKSIVGRGIDLPERDHPVTPNAKTMKPEPNNLA